MSRPLIGSTFALGRGPWKTFDPFLFCVYHNDQYPPGQENLGPNPKLLRNRDIGSDFSYQDGWSMYHGQSVPGFPEHPHRGFETVTVTRKGYVDHSDSMGAAGRYGKGDTQWMTAGKGVQHCEMFPLLDPEGKNPMELFQIWLNLPAKSKFVEPSFKMMWGSQTPLLSLTDAGGKKTSVKVVAGSPEYFPQQKITVPTPPPDSWAADDANDVAIWPMQMEAGATITIPPARSATCNRAIYFFDGDKLLVSPDNKTLTPMNGIKVDASQPITLTAVGNAPITEVLLLQGKPIGEPVAQYGPFVMNTQQEITQAYSDFRQTHFGGWPWPSSDHNHGTDKRRFAKYADERGVEYAPDEQQ